MIILHYIKLYAKTLHNLTKNGLLFRPTSVRHNLYNKMYFKHELKYSKRSGYATDDVESFFWLLQKLSCRTLLPCTFLPCNKTSTLYRR